MKKKTIRFCIKFKEYSILIIRKVKNYRWQLLQLTNLINKYETILLIFRMRFNSAKIKSHVSI